ncbi:MAG: 4-hydroxy-2-oxoheptanedioate aldolase [Rhodobacteraceae bacterium HLUCCA12]|nr:MAG: 4-hydroxy-2-oxoheptanedioate aldolase [Rhodobacteraceae bacterium HLUCCA12]
MLFRLKSRFKAGQSANGTFVFSKDPSSTEIAGVAGFDFVIVDREHSALSWSEITEHARAAQAVGTSMLVRTRGSSGDEVAKALDIGAEGVVIPHFGMDHASGLEAVGAARYAPNGTRGTCTGTRSSGFGLQTFSKIVAEANSEALVVVQIEDKEVLTGLDDLLSAAKVDAVMPGLADLATSFGLPGQFAAAEVIQATEQIFEVADRLGICTGAYIANAGEVERWRERDCDFLVYSIDQKVLAESYRFALSSIQTKQTNY